MAGLGLRISAVAIVLTVASAGCEEAESGATDLLDSESVADSIGVDSSEADSVEVDSSETGDTVEPGPDQDAAEPSPDEDASAGDTDTAAPEPTWAWQDLVPRFPAGGAVRVLPLVFFSAESSRPDAEVQDALDRLNTHVEIARDYLATLTGGATFEVAEGATTFQGAMPDAHYAGLGPAASPDAAHRITAELFEAFGVDRYSADSIYVVVYARPEGVVWDGVSNYFGGGRPFNGSANAGGAYVALEYDSLMTDAYYPFQSTILHELGHGFGLPHVDCYGRDQQTDTSFMSYNPEKASEGFELGPTPGLLPAEERFVLALHDRAIGGLEFDAGALAPEPLDLERLSSCFFEPMDETIGPLIPHEGVGYELFQNGAKVSGAAANLFSCAEAIENCQWNIDQYPDTRIDCMYNGTPLTESLYLD